MRIGIDTSCWPNQRGYGRFTRELLKALLKLDQENEYIFFVDKETNAIAEFPDNVTLKVLNVAEMPSRVASADGRRSLMDMLKFGKAVTIENLDIFFFPSVYTYFPIFNRVKKIVAIHDVIAERFPELVFRNKRRQFFWNLKVWTAIKQASLVLTVSEFSKKGIVEHFRISEDRIRVVSEAADAVFRPIIENDALFERLSRFGLNSSTRFILYVGGIAPHKNLFVLVKAYARFIKDHRYKNIKLVLAGDYDKDVFLKDSVLKEQIKKLDLINNVIFTGFVSDSDLVYLYNGASVFVLPSFCEGFGLPAVEAMACGTPVIGSKTTSLPEVVGDIGLFFDPESPDELLDKLLLIFDKDDYKGKMANLLIQRAAEFSWHLSALQTMKVFDEFKK